MSAIIIGGGIIGPTLAIGLRKQGYKVILNEKNNKLEDMGGGVSVSPNGMRMLSKYIDPNLQVKIQTLGCEILGTKIYNHEGKIQLSFQSNNKEKHGYPLIGIKRYDLQHLLLEHANELGVDIRYNKKLIDMKQEGNKIKAQFSDSSEIEGDVLFGCDGIKSEVKKRLNKLNNIEEAPKYTGLSAVLGISNVIDKVTDDSDFKTFKNDMTVGSYRLNDKECLWFYVFPAEMEAESWGLVSMSNLKECDYLTSKFYEPVPTLIKNTHRSLKIGISDMKSVAPWYHGRVLAMGDAVHPISPFLGQGANIGFEDIATLLQLLKVHDISPDKLGSKDLKPIFETFQQKRKERANCLLKESRLMGNIRFGKRSFKDYIASLRLKAKTRLLGYSIFDDLYSFDLK